MVNISVYVPENLNSEERKAIEKYREAQNFMPTKSIKDRIFSKIRRMFE